MKKALIIVAVVAIVLGVGLSAAGYVYAQNTNPPSTGGQTYGPMMGGWGGHRGMMGGSADGEYGPLHDQMISAWAEKLGLSVEDLNAKLTEGQSMAEIATAQGVTGDAFTTAWVDVHTQVWDEAVAQGLLTADQAQLMKDRMQQRLDAGWVPGTAGANCPMLGGNTGASQGFRGGMMGGRFNR